MRSVWRFLLILLTAFAVPVQGMAAAGMIHCATTPAHEHHEHDGAKGSGANHSHGSHSGVTHASADDSHDSGETSFPDSFKGKAASGAHTCSACSACCVGGALPASTSLIDPPEVSMGHARPVTVGAVSFISSGPPRPPRLHLA